ncbi:MAG: cytoplasmic protein [Oscillospiraceae bacterium]|jgi:hypothetical protein
MPEVHMIDYTIDYIKAHDFSIGHRKRLLQDRKCGCFYCLKIFAPKEISSWIEDVGGTAICPYCGIDSVIGKHSGYPITREFLEQMRQYWF